MRGVDEEIFASLLRAARNGVGAPVRLLLPEGHDDRVIAAGRRVQAEGWAEVTIITDQEVGGVRTVTELELRTQLPSEVSGGLCDVGAAALAAGLYDGAVLGAATHSRDVLAAGLRHLVVKGRRVSGAAWVDARHTRGREVVLVDPSVNVVLDPATLAEGLCDAADFLEQVLETEAVIGLMSWTGLGSGAVDDTYASVVDHVQKRGRQVSGGRPLQADSLIDAVVAESKGVRDPQWRPANVLGFPSLDAANIGVKLVEMLGGAATCSFNTGFAKPFNDISRSADAHAVFAAAALTVAQSRHGR
jgi:phosphotransacetylase